MWASKHSRHHTRARLLHVDLSVLIRLLLKGFPYQWHASIQDFSIGVQGLAPTFTNIKRALGIVIAQLKQNVGINEFGSSNEKLADAPV